MTNLNELTVKELRNLCKDNNLTNYSRANKDILINMLNSLKEINLKNLILNIDGDYYNKETFIYNLFKHDSFNRLNMFSNKKVYNFDWEYQELLDILTSADKPSQYIEFENFYANLLKLLPKYKGEDLILYRGTSIETFKKYFGYFWTEDYNIAEKFAFLCVSARYNLNGLQIDKTPLILKLKIPSQYIAYKHINDAEESEIFLDINFVKYDFLDYLDDIKCYTFD